jgi:ubiquinol-cytochrome c reductase iron-sulfur subunit
VGRLGPPPLPDRHHRRGGWWAERVAAAVPFIASWQPSARAEVAGAPVTEDISKLEPGQRLIVQWRGQPVWILRARPQSSWRRCRARGRRLRDPNSDNPDQQPGYAKNPHRSIKPEISCWSALCTHLGCSPLFRARSAARAVRHGLEGRLLLPLPQLALRHGRPRLPGRAGADQPAVPPYHFVDDNTHR